MRKIPYGIGAFETIRKDNLYYVDKTQFLHTIEKESRYLFFIRPRRFGKTLFLSMMESYYDIAASDHFDFYFNGTAIHENPTAGRSAYLIIKFDFSGIASRISMLEDHF